MAPAGRDATAQLLPELTQPQRALVRQVAGDDRGVDRADRGAGDPVRPDAAILEGGIGAGLISAERAAAGQNQGDAVETGQAPVGSSARHKLLLVRRPSETVGGSVGSPVLVTTSGQESRPGQASIIRGRDRASSLQTPVVCRIRNSQNLGTGIERISDSRA